ncbi:hypothetical protein BG53_01985 [Paenibacillus darwinianus]|uniref:Glycosyl transferase family 28 C-terminal domain-containing protein n=2 Tax=Paenibacillus darwinianus TaxID=1380763 RepID=A0A9W5W7L8_9BACL|nr:hypothetical protein BG53_01985 [Paenibacillus darwinianus]
MFPHFIEMEYRFMRQERIDLVITDISPIACAAAKLAGIVSVGISNFTWYTAYRDLLDEPLLEPLYQAYGQMDCFISLAGAQEPLWGRKEHTQAGFFCRCPEPREIERLKSLMKTDGVEAIVFFALGMSIQVEDLTEMAMWDDESCLFVVSSNMAIDRKNVLRIPEDYTESQNYLAASDLVITKPGWGTISEAVGLVKPLVLLDRGVFPEDRSTAAALEGRHPYLHMEWERLKTIRIKEALSVLTDIDVNLASGNASQINLQQITNYLFGLLDHRERSLAMERGESCQSEFPKGESC